MFFKNLLFIAVVSSPPLAGVQHQQVNAAASADWGWGALAAVLMIVVLFAIYTLSKANESLAKMVSTKTRG